MLEAFSSKPDKINALLDLKKNIDNTKVGFENTHSPMVLYYLKNLEMAYYQMLEDYRQARSVCLELLNIVRNNKSVYRKQRIGVVYINLSQCEYYMGEFNNAVQCAREAQDLFPKKIG
jgi:tetratricopeptide (TPR) repeat protein